MERVPTHEVDRWQAQRIIATITLFLIEVFRLSLQVVNFLPHLSDLLHVQFNLLVILPDHFVLHFETVHKVLLYHFEFEILLRFEDLKDHQGRDDLLLTLVFLKIYDKLQRLLDHVVRLHGAW